MCRILGIPSANAELTNREILELIHPDDRDRIRRLVTHVAMRPDELPEHGLDLEFRLVCSDGTVRELHALGRVETDRTGQAERLIGVAQDVTEQRLSERELRAHDAVSRTLREWKSFELGAPDLLRRIGTALDYPMASLWMWDRAEEALGCRAFWNAPHVDPGDFAMLERRVRFREGEGKQGLAWQTREPVVTPNPATDLVFRPRDAAAACGIASAVALPAVGPAGPVAVLSFYSLERRVPSAELVRTLTAIGSELGRFLSVRQAEFSPRVRPLSERELEVLCLAAEGLSGPRIAEQLFLSLSTVRTHFEHVYEKLGVAGRPAAVALALRTGLIH